MSNARIQFSLASEDVWNAYNPQLNEGEIVTVLKANKKVKLVQGKVGGSTYSESTVIWDEDEAETTMSRAEAAAVTATAQANAASGSASKAAASQAAAATSATNAKASENAAANSETNAKASATAAKNSATSAASSASTASTQAGKAADSATAAAGSAAQASTFATTATNKATAADKSATAADKSATAADKSATAAAASAVTASDKASEAATSATNAAVSATSAAGAAEEAQGLISKAEYGFLERNKKYAVGDIAYTTQLPAGYYLECVTAGTTGNTEPTISVESENVNDGTVKWGVKNIQDASKLGLPVGFEAFTINPNLQAGWLPLLGGEYSRTAYADLWAWVQTQQGYLIEESAWQAKATANGGNVPFYSKGDGSTTFRVPALKCWVKGASNISEVGGYLVAGLPNIDTNVYIGQDGSGYPNGSADSTTVGSTASYPRKTKLFRASDYNTIYGTSDTVQPPSIVGLWVVKAYGVVTNVGSTDVANISTGLAQAETRISSLETNKVDKAGNAWVVEFYRNGTEWYRVWSDGWVEQGGYISNNDSANNYAATVTFLKAFANTNYTLVGIGYPMVVSDDYNDYVSEFSAVSFKWRTRGCGSAKWYACGMGA
ncbi:hypothetical protein ACQRCN_00480 [Phascolarctobacterium succinatutens]|uniref:hypothetical protein n=1 Tax=Phascolarctobacterium succinatutens TaxID=626940 RepID=UPI003CFF4625